MAETGFIDALSPEAEKRILAYNKQVIELIGNIGKASAVQIGGKTPSQSDSAIKSLNDQLIKQDEIIKKLQIDYLKLAETKKNQNALSVQERVDNSILLQQQKQQAVIVSQVADAYKKLSAQEAEAARNLQNIIVRGRTATQTQRQFNAEVSKAQKEWQGYRTRILAADEAVGRWGRLSKRTIQGARDLASAFGIAFGVAGAVALGKSIYETTKQTQSLDLALKQVVGTAEQFNSAQSFLNRISDAYGQDIQALTKQYTQFYVSAKDKISQKEIEDIFESVSKAAGAMGLSAENSERAFLALNQMLSKGTIQSEELKGQLGEALPGAFGILAKSMNVNEQQLGKLLKDGKVLAAEVLPAFAKELEKAYGIENLNRVESLAAAQSRLGNSWTEFVRSLNDGGNGLSIVFSELLSVLDNVLKGITLIFESAASARDKAIKSLTDKGYQDYIKGISELSKQELENTKKYNSQTIEENAKMIAELQSQNTELAKVSSRSVKITDNNAEIQKLNNLNALRIGQNRAINEVLNEQNKIIPKNTALTKDQLKAIEDASRQAYENRRKELELELQVIDRTLNDEEVYYNTRIRALDLHWKKRQEILLLNYNEELRRAKGNFGKQKEAMLNFHSESLKEIEAYNKERERLDKLELQSAGVVDSSDPRKLLNDSAEQSISDFEKQAAAAKQYEENLKMLNKAMMDYVKTFSDSFAADSGFQTTFDILSDKILGFGSDVAVTTVAVMEAFQEMYNFISNISQANFEAQVDRINQEKEIAIAFAGENAEARAEIEREADERIRQAKRRQAKEDKQLALFNIGINTAQAIVAFLAQGNIAASFFAGIIGAVQLAVVASKPIPEFYKGTENAPNGYAWTQERGQELILDKNDNVKSYGNNKGVQLTKLDAGDKVKTADETKRILSNGLIFDNHLNNIMQSNGILPPVVVQNNATAFNNEQVGRIVEAVRNIPVAENVWQDGEVRNYIRKNGVREEIQNARNKVIIRSV